jgi:hypothetical protein
MREYNIYFNEYHSVSFGEGINKIITQQSKTEEDAINTFIKNAKIEGRMIVINHIRPIKSQKNRG